LGEAFANQVCGVAGADDEVVGRSALKALGRELAINRRRQVKQLSDRRPDPAFIGFAF
jgi:hypothetical protein